MNDNITINKYSLNFSDIEIEKRFDREYLQKTKIYFRWGVLISILLYNSFHVFDYRFNQHDFWFLVTDRILMITAAAIFFIFSFTKHYEKLFDSLLSMLFLAIGLGTVGVVYIDLNVIHTFYPVAVFFTLIPKISLRKAFIINYINATALAIVLIFFSDIETENALLQSFLAFSTAMVAIMVLYIKNKTEKISFLKSLRLEENERKIKEQYEELQTAGEELRQNNEELQSLNENIQSQKDIIENKSKELQKYYTAIEQSEATIVFTDSKGSIEYANPYFTKLTGYTPGEALGKNPRILKSGKTPKNRIKELWDTILSGQTWRGEFINRKKDGTEFYEQAIISPMKNENGEITNFVAVKEDITALKQYEQELKTKNEELQTANNEILAGINYASLIQKSMLTSDDIINTYFSEYFLIYKPKDIVSGDFYYVNKIENHLIIAVADCTGHGVAGAFITVLGITYLNNAIIHKKINSTNTALEFVRERFKAVFATFGSDGKNGMDIALCALNLDSLVMQYSGANLPLLIVRNGELIEQKPTRCPIGNYPIDIDFVQNEFQLEKSDTIYMFSDGIYDQLGGKQIRKYQNKNFRTLILENSSLSLETQKQKILDNFENWKGENQQTDDVTVLGFKI